MPFRRRGARDEDEEKEEVPEPLPQEPPPPVTLHKVLEEQAPILKWLSFHDAATGIFHASSALRVFLSCQVRAQVTFDVEPVHAGDELDTPRSVDERRRRIQRTNVRLPRSAAGELLKLHLKCKLTDVPLRRAALNRTTGRLMPMVKWEEIPEMRIRLRSQAELVDRLLYANTMALEGTDVLAMMMEHPDVFRNLVRVSLTVPQLVALDDEFCMPQVTRLKLHCKDIAFAGTALERIGQAFPNANRLHLFLLPIGLLPLCGPSFSAPKDLRLTLNDSAGGAEREANVFVASHLLTMPFSWGDVLFRNVVRLQMSELNEDHAGLSMEQMASTIKALPLLKRLGTVSNSFAKLLDVAKEEFHLEELVIVIEVDDIAEFFKILLPLEQRKGRCSLKRLCVHLLASDGVSRLKLPVENATCAAWHNIANNFLHPEGLVVFSVAAKQILETAVVQLAWFDPCHFNIDGVEYGEVRHPMSTAAERDLPYWGTDAMERPNGTLVSGPLRPSSSEMQLEDSSEHSPRSDVVSPASHSSPPTPHKSGKGKKSRNKFTWIGMNLVDALDVLLVAQSQHQ